MPSLPQSEHKSTKRPPTRLHGELALNRALKKIVESTIEEVSKQQVGRKKEEVKVPLRSAIAMMD